MSKLSLLCGGEAPGFGGGEENFLFRSASNLRFFTSALPPDKLAPLLFVLSLPLLSAGELERRWLSVFVSGSSHFEKLVSGGVCVTRFRSSSGLSEDSFALFFVDASSRDAFLLLKLFSNGSRSCSFSTCSLTILDKSNSSSGNARFLGNLVDKSLLISISFPSSLSF